MILRTDLFKYRRQEYHIIGPYDKLVELKHLLPHLPDNRPVPGKATPLNKPQHIIRQLRKYNPPQPLMILNKYLYYRQRRLNPFVTPLIVIYISLLLTLSEHLLQGGNQYVYLETPLLCAY